MAITIDGKEYDEATLDNDVKNSNIFQYGFCCCMDSVSNVFI